jgi:hypothetical protein
MKMAIPAVRRDSHFTYGDDKLWPEDERWELIEGVAYEMAGPSLPRQSAVGELYFRLRTFLEGKRFAVFVAPLDILLPSSESQDDEEVDTVVQPDGFGEGDYRSAGQTLSSSVLAGFEVVVAQVFLA